MGGGVSRLDDREIHPDRKVDEWGHTIEPEKIYLFNEKGEAGDGVSKSSAGKGAGGIGYDSAHEAEDEENMDPKLREKLKKKRMVEGELKRAMEEGSVEMISSAVGNGVAMGAHEAYIFSGRVLMTRLAEGFLGFGPKEDKDKPEKQAPAFVKAKEMERVADFLRKAMVERESPAAVQKAIDEVQTWALSSAPAIHMLVRSGASLQQVLASEVELRGLMEEHNKLNKLTVGWNRKGGRPSSEITSKRQSLLRRFKEAVGRVDNRSQTGKPGAENLALVGQSATVGADGLTWEVDSALISKARLVLRGMALEMELEKAMRAEDPTWIAAVTTTCEEEGVAVGEELLMRAAQVKEKVSLEDQLGVAMEKGAPGELQEVLERCQLAEDASTADRAIQDQAQTKLERMQAMRMVATYSETGGPGQMQELRAALMRAQEAGVPLDDLEAAFDVLRRWWSQVELSMGTTGVVNVPRLLGALGVAQRTAVDAGLVEHARRLSSNYHRLSARVMFPPAPAPVGGAFGSPSWLKNPHLSISVMGETPVNVVVSVVDAMGDEDPGSAGRDLLVGKYSMHAVVNREGVAAGHVTPGFRVVSDTPYSEERAEMQLQKLEPVDGGRVPSIFLVPSRARAAASGVVIVTAVVSADDAFLPDGSERVRLRICDKLDDHLAAAVAAGNEALIDTLLHQAAEAGQDHTVDVINAQKYLIRRRVERTLQDLLKARADMMNHRAEDLEEALLLAQEVDADPALVTAARAEVARRDAQLQLSRAMEGNSTLMEIQAALLKAQRVGLDSDLVRTARGTAQRLRADAELRSALKLKNPEHVLAAHEGARSAGLQGQAVEDAREILDAHAVMRLEDGFARGTGSAYGTPMWGDNPQFRITASGSEPVEVFMVLSRTAESELTDTAVHVVTAQGASAEQATRHHRLVAGTIYSETPSMVMFVAEPSGGPYYIVPSRSSPSEKGRYVLSVLAEGNARVERISTLQETLAAAVLNRNTPTVRDTLEAAQAAGLGWHPVAGAATEALAELEAEEELYSAEAEAHRDPERYKRAVARGKAVKLDAALLEPHLVSMLRATLEYELLRATDKSQLALMRALLDQADAVGVEGGKVGLAKAVMRQLRCRTQLGHFSQGMLVPRRQPSGEMAEVVEGYTAGGPFGGVTWRSNPQYELKLHGSKPVKVHISVAETPRAALEGEDHQAMYFHHYCLHVLSNSREAAAITRELVPGWKMVGSTDYQVAPSGLDIVLDPAEGPFFIIPSTSDAGEEGSFSLSVMSEDLITMKLVKPRKPTLEFSGAFDEGVLQGKREPRITPGSVLSEGKYQRRPSITWLNNPQFRLRCHSGSAVVLAVLQLEGKEVPKGGLGMHLMLNKPSDFLDVAERVLPGQYQEVVHKSETYEDNTLEVSLTLKLTKQEGDQPYFLVPSLYKKRLGGRFKIQLYVERGEVSAEAVK
mmetsp:Transcript_69168/g.218804  ORF Transcript_69168/g.218804 Transcript_69168/m.218804 type:complete len:1444 (+) Transcript_69168:95-4426(+)